MGFAEHRSCPLRSVCPLDRSPAGAKISLGLLCLFEQKLWPLHFVVFSRAPVFSLVPLNRTPPPNTTTSSLSVCRCNTWPTKTHTFLYFHLQDGEKKRPWKFLRDIKNWLIFFIFYFYFLKARRYRASAAIYHRNLPLPTCPRLVQTLELSSVSAECVTSSVAEVINTE